MKYVYGRKKWLAAGIAALLISGAGVVPDVLAAPVYTSGITTKAKKDKATFGSAYKVENGVNNIIWKTDQKSVSTALITLKALRRGKERHPLSPWAMGQERCPLILPAVTREIRRGRGFSHLTGAG